VLVIEEGRGTLSPLSAGHSCGVFRSEFGCNLSKELRQFGFARINGLDWTSHGQVAVSVEQHGNVRHSGRGRVIHRSGQIGFREHRTFRRERGDSSKPGCHIKPKPKAAC